tara:strand:- start:260 stop:892 length:633 start_codon:yes stop_codon:yes gene_type:complete
MSENIVIVDVGMGNSGSVSNMLKYLGIEHIRSDNPDDLKHASKIILPGVGSFDACMRVLKDAKLIDPLINIGNDQNKMMLGICLGMQILFESSEEGNADGLGLIKGKVKRFNIDQPNVKIPHMGWNEIKLKSNNIFTSDYTSSRFYFVHSYHVNCENPEDILATTFYGYQFVSAIKKLNIIGVQFHPEKSHKYGLRLFSDFAKAKCITTV